MTHDAWAAVTRSRDPYSVISSQQEGDTLRFFAIGQPEFGEAFHSVATIGMPGFRPSGPAQSALMESGPQVSTTRGAAFPVGIGALAVAAAVAYFALRRR